MKNLSKAVPWLCGTAIIIALLFRMPMKDVSDYAGALIVAGLFVYFWDN